MTSIEVFAPQEATQTIDVHETPIPRDNAKEALRYREEAKQPGLSDGEKWAKNDTANYLASLALQDRVLEYTGKKPPSSR